jgi:TATA-box binding protein (TBP) (component of TFIID and TFIIIB)
MATFPKQRRVNFKREELNCQKVTYNPNATTSTVTQITNRSTGVTLNTTCGQITTDATSLAAAAEAKFVVTNDKVKAKDVVVVCAASGQTADTSIVNVVAVADGSFTLQLTNLNASTADTGAMVINFLVLGAE